MKEMKQDQRPEKIPGRFGTSRRSVVLVLTSSFLQTTSALVTTQRQSSVIPLAFTRRGLARTAATSRQYVSSVDTNEMTSISSTTTATPSNATDFSAPETYDTETYNIQYQENLSLSASPDIAAGTGAKEEKLTLWEQVQEKIGTVDESRMAFPEYNRGEVPRLFSSLEYTEEDSDSKRRLVAKHAAGSVVGAAALVAGTTVGAGVLALPTATAAAGFLPSTAAMLVAYVYMTMSGLLIAELTLNQMGRTGRPGLGLLELYESSLGKPWSMVGSAAYFFLHYAMMVAYIAQGGTNLESIFGTDIAGQLPFAAIMAGSLLSAKPAWIEKVNNLMVLGVAASFLGIVGIGAGTADWGALLDPANQHPDQVVSCFPILFLALVYQNVVPTVVTNLEGDRTKITQAIIGGTTAPLLMFLAWNAVCLGNVMGAPGVDMTNIDPVALLQSGQAGAAGLLGPLVTTFSVLALVTSIVGFTYGLIDAWTDVFRINAKSDDYTKWKPALFALVFGPPLALSMADPDIFYRALEYGGAFGVSTLFLVLPPLMVWKERYRDTDTPVMTKPMVPFGKLPLGSMWKAALTLIAEQGAEKLGVFHWIEEHILNQGL